MTVKLSLSEPSSQRQLTAIADSIVSAKRVVFVSGAGISCSAGIPVCVRCLLHQGDSLTCKDFRSMGGLYSTKSVDSKVKGKDLFDVSLFANAHTTSLFYKFMAELRDSMLAAEPTTTHKFLRLMKDHGTLLRSYTQNIDGLESRVGLNLAPCPLKANDVIQLHGDIHSLKCFLCSEVFAYSQDYATILRDGRAPECATCSDKCAIRVACGRRPIAIGTLRPDVVLYGENHPSGDSIAQACSADLKRKPDCLIIAGTSLKVPGLKTLIKDFAREVHRRDGKVIFLNLSEVGTSEWSRIIDYHVQGSSDDFVDFLRLSRPAYFTRQTTLDSLRRTRPQRRDAPAKKHTDKPRMLPKDVRSTHSKLGADSPVVTRKLVTRTLNIPPIGALSAQTDLPNIKIEVVDVQASTDYKARTDQSGEDDKENINPLRRSRAEAFPMDPCMMPARKAVMTNLA